VTSVRLIQGDVTRAEAEAVAGRALGTQQATLERELFYPYYWFLMRASWTTLFGPRGGRLCCLVDARTRVVSTSDPFETETAAAPAASVLGSTLEEEDAERLARRAARRTLGRIQRALAPPAFELLDHALLHKRFWVAREGGRRLLVDGVTGRVHPLERAEA
jgi:hypothetical protein